jgi:hypothetical protein
MMDGTEERRKIGDVSGWVEIDHIPVCSKNGKVLTLGKAEPNGGGLTSGPGFVNGFAFTSQTPEQDAARTPTGLHLLPEDVNDSSGEFMPTGLGLRRDLINGFSIEAKKETWTPHKLRLTGRSRLKTKKRLEELAERPIPGTDGN